MYVFMYHDLATNSKEAEVVFIEAVVFLFLNSLL